MNNLKHALSSGPTTSTAGYPAHRSAGVRTVSSTRATTLVDDRDEVSLHAAATSMSWHSRAVVSSPLRAIDPVNVDGYRLVSRLGSGGMADVFLAVGPTGEHVAVKLLRDGDRALETCRREYELTCAMDANHTAPALAYGVSVVGPYLVTKFLPGYECGTTLLGKRMSTRKVWAFGSALAAVLAAVHARGVIHCDVKPSNLLVWRRDVRLIDFGIARYAGERCGGDGTVECSRGWASPEQLRSELATPAVDVFAWGCVLAYLACGVHPFASEETNEWIVRVESAQPDVFDLPWSVDDVIRRALAREPLDRPTAAELTAICSRRGSGRPRPARRVSTGPAAAFRNEGRE
jgi:serine/threonine protein kinase